MKLLRVLIHEAFLPAATLLVVTTLVEFIEPGFASGVVNLPMFMVGVVILGVARAVLDRSGTTN